MPKRTSPKRSLLSIGRILPLFALGFGSGSLFLANVAAKRLFSADRFTEWTYLSFLVSVFFSFSLLGTEQLVVRSTQRKGSGLSIPVETIVFLAGGFTLFLAAYSILLDGHLTSYRLGWSAPLFLLAVGTLQVVFQMERSRENLSAAQLTYNIWKVVILFAVLASNHFELSPRYIFIVALLTGVLIALAYYATQAKHITIASERTDNLQIIGPFTLAMGAMAMLSSIDRVLIDTQFDGATFANYVYCWTVLGTPFALLSSYFGFSEAARYRRSFTIEALRANCIQAGSLSITMVIAWYAGCYLFRSELGLNFELSLWAIFAFGSVVRCIYGVLSAAMSVRGTPKAVLFANVSTICAIVCYYMTARLTQASVTLIALGGIVVWTFRGISYFAHLYRDQVLLTPKPQPAK